MPNLWYGNHRFLAYGARGPDVKRVQHALNDMGASPKLEPNGIFDKNTEDAVKNFQKMMNLVEDGKVGPITSSVLLGGSFRYAPTRPPWVRQGSRYLCWAASLESVLERGWSGRPRLNMAALRTTYAKFLAPRGNINVAGFRQAAKDLRFEEVLKGRKVRAEHILKFLRTRGPLLLVDNSTGSIMHTRVIHGVKISKGAIDLLMMDPMRGYTEVPIGTVQFFTRMGFFAAK